MTSPVTTGEVELQTIRLALDAVNRVELENRALAQKLHRRVRRLEAATQALRSRLSVLRSLAQARPSALLEAVERFLAERTERTRELRLLVRNTQTLLEEYGGLRVEMESMRKARAAAQPAWNHVVAISITATYLQTMFSKVTAVLRSEVRTCLALLRETRSAVHQRLRRHQATTTA